MDSRAITLIATIAVIGIVAVGAGYAYTAITVNDDNSASAKYVTITQSDNYTFSANTMEYFDSLTMYDGDEVKAYTVSDTPAAQKASVTGYTMVKLGTVTFTTTPHGYAHNSDLIDNISVTVTSTGLTEPVSSHLHYYLVDGSNKVLAKTTAANTWVNVTNDAVVGIVIKKAANLDADAEPTSASYSPIALTLCYGFENADDSNVEYNAVKYTISEPQNFTDGKIVFAATINDPAS